MIYYMFSMLLFQGEKTGSSFKDLPSVLQFKLARFKSDANKNRTVKVSVML